MSFQVDDDRRGIEQMKAQFDAISQLAEGDFKGTLTHTLTMNHYATVYNYAVKNAIGGQVDEHYLRHETLYIDFQEMLTRFMLRFQPDPRWGEVELFYRIVKWWKHYKVVQQWSLKTFAYVSRFYVTHYAKMPLHQVAMSIFLEQLFRKYEGIVRNQILEMIQRERRHEASDRETVQSAIEMYSAMGIDGLNTIYMDNFLRPFIAASSEFYKKESAVWASTDGATEYLMKAEQRLAEEKTRCLKYFPMEEERRVMESVEIALLDTEVARRVLFRSPSSFSTVVERRDLVNLKRFYKLFAHIPAGLDAMAAALKDRLIFEGTEKAKFHGGNERDINCKDCVSDLVTLHEDFMSLQQSCFCSNPVIMKALKDGLERVFNNGIVAQDASNRSTVVSFSELLANYLDMILRQPPGDDQQVESTFDQIVNVLRYVSDSDHFQQHARELLAKRLLSQTSKPNDQLERLLLTRLKQRCGAHFTTQFEGMMNDRVTSIELSDRFVQSLSTPLAFEFHCLVLKTGIWPKFPVEDGVRPPPEFAAVIERFARFHSDEAQHRVLRWSHSSSHVTLTARLKGSVKELQLTAYQAWVLLLYNTPMTSQDGSQDENWTVEAMLEELKLDFEELKRILLSFAKIKLVMRVGDSTNGPLQRSDAFALNTEFSSPHRKITIPLVAQHRITVAGTVKATQQADEDRKPAIEACLVRIMKSRRELSHNDLVNECIAQLASRFSPDTKIIKQRIEDLIKREYMERNADNSSVYRYLS